MSDEPPLKYGQKTKKKKPNKTFLKNPFVWSVAAPLPALLGQRENAEVKDRGGPRPRAGRPGQPHPPSGHVSRRGVPGGHVKCGPHPLSPCRPLETIKTH